MIAISRRDAKIFFAIVVVGSLFTVSGCAMILDEVPPKTLTQDRLKTTQKRIEIFAVRNKKVPKNKSELPLLPSRDCEMVDGWSQPLFWESDGATHVRVWSLGRDGVQGGKGEDEDLELFYTTDPYESSVEKNLIEVLSPEIEKTDPKPSDDAPSACRFRAFRIFRGSVF